ncbi:uncharacterized protein [Drosophila tropicalis]|uniref:uncharacterized protein n=1 Tax=Drosophila tropicalis TaxID=46794 RepID=UPI0035ABE818
MADEAGGVLKLDEVASGGEVSATDIQAMADNTKILQELVQLVGLKMYVQARAKMTKTAKLFLEAIQVCQYSELRMTLESEFGQRSKCSAEIHAELRDQKKHNQESFHEYLLQMRKLAAVGDVDVQSVIRYIVDGLQLKSDFRYTLYGCKSFQELQEQYAVYERVAERSARPFLANETNQKRSPHFPNKQKHCFNCGSVEHFPADINVVRDATRVKRIAVNGVDVECLVDTGADVSLVTKSVFNNIPGVMMKKWTSRLRGLGNNMTRPVGCFEAEYAKDVKRLIQNYKLAEAVAEVPVKLRIVPDGEITPFRQSPSRLAIAEEIDVEKQIDEWLAAGIIRPSSSNYASRLVLVNKKDGTRRICVDFRKLNLMVLKDCFPVPVIDDVLDKLQNAKLFTVMDLEKGFFHVPIEEENFDYEVEHRPGERLKHVDCLSRNPCILVASLEITARIKAAQAKDDTLKVIVEILGSRPFEGYKMKGGLLYREENGNDLLVVPKQMEKEVIIDAHNISESDPTKWFKAVPEVQRPVNSQTHKTTKKSPFELMFGVKMNNKPADRLIQLLEEEMYQRFDEERQLMRQNAKAEIIQAQKSYKKYFDNKRKPEAGYQVGDLVAIRRTQFDAGKKLSSEYLGPYEVTQVKRNGRYDVRKAADVEGPTNTSTSCDYIKMWRYIKDNEDDLSSGTDE